MREIGGYIELDKYYLPMLHENAIALNCGRNALAYLFMSRNIRRIKLPFFICDSVINICEREGIEKTYYHIGMDFRPLENVELDDDEWLYLVNFYGQLSNDVIEKYVNMYKRVIVDQANAYFQKPIAHVDTIYTCRKWFGVPDGAFLYTDRLLNNDFPLDESFDRMGFLLGRFERSASEFYDEYNNNNRRFKNEPIKKMSKLTRNLLHAIDYNTIQRIRASNYSVIQDRLSEMNQLCLNPCSFMYPLMIEDGTMVRKKLQHYNVYIPTLWPSVFGITKYTDLEYMMAQNILPLPIDQRYGAKDMEHLVTLIMNCI